MMAEGPICTHTHYVWYCTVLHYNLQMIPKFRQYCKMHIQHTDFSLLFFIIWRFPHLLLSIYVLFWIKAVIILWQRKGLIKVFCAIHHVHVCMWEFWGLHCLRGMCWGCHDTAKSYCDVLQYMTTVSQYVLQYIALELYIWKSTK